VFHAAAYVDEHGPLAAHLRVSFHGTEHVLAAARAARVKRFVHVSTEAVLADGHPIVHADETRPLPARQLGSYGVAKARAEQAVLAANGGDGLETVVVRPRFIWGRGDTTLLRQIRDAVREKRFVWIDGGRYQTSTAHVDNVAEALVLAAERGTPGAVYFVTDGAPVEFRDFVTRWLATQGIDPGTRSIPRWLARLVATSTAWMKHPPFTRDAFAVIAHEVTVDDAKARRELGYRGARSREDGLAEMAADRSLGWNAGRDALPSR
jgi:nucleoside-diphosphate-sugar epimerase